MSQLNDQNNFHAKLRINQDDKEITYQYRGDGLRHGTQVRKLTESQGKTNLYCWDGSNIVAEQTDGGKIITYLRGINLIAREIDRVVYYYIFNEHGDVTQLWSQNGTCKASYEYDAFGIERNPDKEDENPFRYCGEYYDLSSSTYYLRARSSGNMIYGDNPMYNENKMKVPNILAIMQSYNLYSYGINNPVRYIDPMGNDVWEFIRGLWHGIASAASGGQGSIADPRRDNNTRTNPKQEKGQNNHSGFITGGDSTYAVAHWMGEQYADFVLNHDFVFDDSISAGLPISPLSATIGYSYLQGNASDYTAGYVHVGGGGSIGIMPVSGSAALGIVENADTPEAYSEWFVDISTSMGVGAEYCEWPGGSSATSIRRKKFTDKPVLGQI